MSLANSLSFKLNFPQVPENPEVLEIYLALQNLAYFLDKFTGRYPQQSDQYPQLGVENLNSATLNRFYCQAGSAIAPGDLIYLAASGTTVKANPARANSISTQARGIYLGSTGLILNDWAEFILSPTILTTSGLTPGSSYYLSTSTAGLYQAARPTVAGEIIQDIGFAISDTLLFVTPGNPVILL